MRIWLFLSLMLTPFFVDASTSKNKQEDVSTFEDLMPEHGIVNRLLLIYEEISERIGNYRIFPRETLFESANIVRSFVENYHEKLEEEYIFPKFGNENGLVKTLVEQHEAGRLLTDYILSHLTEDDLKNDIQRTILADYLKLYIRMYRTHEASEDTILFPAFRKLVSEKEYKKIGKIFGDKEHELFGEKGFETIVQKVEEIEKKLNIYKLAEFIPKRIQKSGI